MCACAPGEARIHVTVPPSPRQRTAVVARRQQNRLAGHRASRTPRRTSAGVAWIAGCRRRRRYGGMGPASQRPPPTTAAAAARRPPRRARCAGCAPPAAAPSLTPLRRGSGAAPAEHRPQRGAWPRACAGRPQRRDDVRQRADGEAGVLRAGCGPDRSACARSAAAAREHREEARRGRGVPALVARGRARLVADAMARGAQRARTGPCPRSRGRSPRRSRRVASSAVAAHEHARAGDPLGVAGARRRRPARCDDLVRPARAPAAPGAGTAPAPRSSRRAGSGAGSGSARRPPRAAAGRRARRPARRRARRPAARGPPAPIRASGFRNRTYGASPAASAEVAAEAEAAVAARLDRPHRQVGDRRRASRPATPLSTTVTRDARAAPASGSTQARSVSRLL